MQATNPIFIYRHCLGFAMFTLAASFLNEQIEDSREINEKYGGRIDSLFGISTDIPFDGGREFFNVPQISTQDLIGFVHRCNDSGLGFNFVLNTTLVENKDFENKAFLNLLESCHSRKNGVILANDSLHGFIKQNFPKFTRRASRIYNPLTEKSILGLCSEFDVVVLREQLNGKREFIRRLPAEKIELIANSFCFKGCGKIPKHYDLISGMNRRAIEGEDPGELCLSHLQGLGLCDSHTMESIDNVRIEPEQIQQYLDLGIRHFKILDRMNPPTKSLAERYVSYASGAPVKSLPVVQHL